MHFATSVQKHLKPKLAYLSPKVPDWQAHTVSHSFMYYYSWGINAKLQWKIQNCPGDGYKAFGDQFINLRGSQINFQFKMHRAVSFQREFQSHRVRDFTVWLILCI